VAYGDTLKFSVPAELGFFLDLLPVRHLYPFMGVAILVIAKGFLMVLDMKCAQSHPLVQNKQGIRNQLKCQCSHLLYLCPYT
jgi:hypothetical protein